MNKIVVLLLFIIISIQLLWGNGINSNNKVVYGCPIQSDYLGLRYWLIDVDRKRNKSLIRISGASLQSLKVESDDFAGDINLPQWTESNGAIHIITESSNDYYYDFKGTVRHYGDLKQFSGYLIIQGRYREYKQLILADETTEYSRNIYTKCYPPLVST